jgi:hypothetical protein
MLPTSRRRFLAGLSAGPVARAARAGLGLRRDLGLPPGVAEAAARDPVLAAFYRARGFEGDWSGAQDREVTRRNALLAAMLEAPTHGLARGVTTPRRWSAGSRPPPRPTTRAWPRWRRAAPSCGWRATSTRGCSCPPRWIPHIKREVLAADPLAVMTVFPEEEPNAFLRGLAPRRPNTPAS